MKNVKSKKNKDKAVTILFRQSDIDNAAFLQKKYPYLRTTTSTVSYALQQCVDKLKAKEESSIKTEGIDHE